MDTYLNAEPSIPLPKKSPIDGLTFAQLNMLWLMWASGLTLSVLAFLVECMTGSKAHRQNVVGQKTGTRAQGGNTRQHSTLKIPSKKQTTNREIFKKNNPMPGIEIV